MTVAISGAVVRDLVPHSDARGMLFELFREDWGDFPTPRQWNLVRTQANTLRGVHVHRCHDDYLIVVSGVMFLGLHDIRANSPTRDRSALLRLGGNHLQAGFVPRGVLHGFYFPSEATYVYGLTSCWTPADDLGCRWDDPDLGIEWPTTDPIVSERDKNALGLAGLKARLSAD